MQTKLHEANDESVTHTQGIVDESVTHSRQGVTSGGEWARFDGWHCIACGAPFWKKRPTAKTCSSKCRQQFYRAMKNGGNLRKYKRSPKGRAENES